MVRLLCPLALSHVCGVLCQGLAQAKRDRERRRWPELPRGAHTCADLRWGEVSVTRVSVSLMSYSSESREANRTATSRARTTVTPAEPREDGRAVGVTHAACECGSDDPMMFHVKRRGNTRRSAWRLHVTRMLSRPARHRLHDLRAPARPVRCWPEFVARWTAPNSCQILVKTCITTIAMPPPACTRSERGDRFAGTEAFHVKHVSRPDRLPSPMADEPAEDQCVAARLGHCSINPATFTSAPTASSPLLPSRGHCDAGPPQENVRCPGFPVHGFAITRACFT